MMKKYLSYILILCLFLFGFTTYIDLAANYHWTGAHIFDSLQLGNSANNGSIELPLAGNTAGQEGNWRLIIDESGHLLRQYCTGSNTWTTKGTDMAPQTYNMTIVASGGFNDTTYVGPPFATADTFGIADAVTITLAYDEIALYPGTITGTDVIDSTGSYNLAITGGVTQTANGKVGDCLTFDGSTGYATHATLWDAAPAAMTISVWVYRTTLVGAQTIINKDNTLSPLNTFILYFDDNGTAVRTTKYNGNTPVVLIGATTTAINTWYHVVVTCGAAGYKLYVNGNEDATNASTSFMGNGTATNFTLGAYNSGVNKLSGRLDQIRLFNEQKDQTWVTAEYNSGNGR